MSGWYVPLMTNVWTEYGDTTLHSNEETDLFTKTWLCWCLNKGYACYSWTIKVLNYTSSLYKLLLLCCYVSDMIYALFFLTFTKSLKGTKMVIRSWYSTIFDKTWEHNWCQGWDSVIMFKTTFTNILVIYRIGGILNLRNLIKPENIILVSHSSAMAKVLKINH